MLHTTNTKHNHQMVFGKLELGCPRCEELATGAPVRQWHGANRKRDEQRTLEAIRNHDFAACAAKNIVCTHFDW